MAAVALAGLGFAPAHAAQDRPAPDLPANALRITEVLAYAPGRPEAEYVELYNPGPGPQDLSGWYLLDDDDSHAECPLEGTLPPGEYLVVAGNLAAFRERFEVARLNPHPFGGNDSRRGFALDRKGDAIRLFRPTPAGGVLVHGFTFGLQSENIPFGFVPLDADAPEYLRFPTPGADNTEAGPRSPVCISEFHTTSRAGGVDDWIELYNRGDATVDIGGWHLSDHADRPRRYTFPPGTRLAPGACLVVDETRLGFSFSSSGSEILMLTHADGVTGQDYFDYGPQSPDVSQGRDCGGSPYWRFFSEPSPGRANPCSRTAPDPLGAR